MAGSYNDDVNGNSNQGSAYVFHRVNGNWVQQAQLTATDGAPGDLFGYSVSIFGNYIVVGAPEDNIGFNPKQGSVYVFQRNGEAWTQQVKRVAPDGAAGDNFGKSVSINNNQFIVGAPGDAIGTATGQGSATVFLMGGNTWSAETKLTATDGLTGDAFGSSVSITGGFAIIGAPGDDNSGSNPGSAYLYTKIVAWNFIQKLLPTGYSLAPFGEAVSIDGIYAAVRQTVAQTSGFEAYLSGRVFVYMRGALGIWFEQAVLLDPHPTFVNIFGLGISLSGDLLAVGTAPIATLQNGPKDSAYVFLYKRNGSIWELQREIYDSTPTYDEKFGSAVFISGFNLVIGVPNKKNKKGEVQFIQVE